MSLPTLAMSLVERRERYDDFEALVRLRGAEAPWPRFTTNADPCALWAAYLYNLPEHRRQHYRCHACSHFIQHFGGLATIDENGFATPVLWGSWENTGIPDFFANSVLALSQIVLAAKVTGVFISDQPIWGTPKTGPWTHLCCPNTKRHEGRTQTASQVMAEKKQDYIMLRQALAEIPLSAAEQAVRVLEADALDRSEKTLGVAKWFFQLHRAVKEIDNRRSADNLLWRAVALAPPGFCHIRSTMIGTLLDDLIAGLPYESVAARWAAKMHPLQYQRPTAPKEGAIKEAEKVVEKLASAGALARRFARIEDVVAAHKPLWLPPTAAPEEKPARSGGVFDHLKSKGREVKPLALPAQSIRWTKFRDEVLPAALSVEVQVPGWGGFYGLVTAANPEAPPILQWDGLADLPRNPVSHYFYIGGSSASRWGLAAGSWVNVAAVFTDPSHWQKPDSFKHHTEMAMFALAGAQDREHKAGGGFFPECLRSEYHGIRQVMEAHAGEAPIADPQLGTANGIALQKGTGILLQVRVTTAAGVTEYRIDRWD